MNWIQCDWEEEKWDTQEVTWIGLFGLFSEGRSDRILDFGFRSFWTSLFKFAINTIVIFFWLIWPYNWIFVLMQSRDEYGSNPAPETTEDKPFIIRVINPMLIYNCDLLLFKRQNCMVYACFFHTYVGKLGFMCIMSSVVIIK